MISLSIVGYFFFYATSFESVSSSGVLMAICKLTYLMCLEGLYSKQCLGEAMSYLMRLETQMEFFKQCLLLAF